MHLPSLLALTLLSPPLQPGAQNLLPPPGEELIVSSPIASDGGAVRIFDLKTGRLKQRLRRPSWQAQDHRAMALDGDGRLWVQNGNQLQTRLDQFDRQGRFLRSFALDLAPLGSPFFPDISGMVFDDERTLWLAGVWENGTEAYLLQVDPEAEVLLAFTDTGNMAPAFSGARLNRSVDGSAIYLTERTSALGAASNRILRLGSGMNLLSGPPGAKDLGSVHLLPGGGMVVGDVDRGELWMTSPNGLVWTMLQGCSKASTACFFAVSHGFAFVHEDCAAPGQVAAVRLRNGKVGARIDVTVGGQYSDRISHVLVRP